MVTYSDQQGDDDFINDPTQWEIRRDGYSDERQTYRRTRRLRQRLLLNGRDTDGEPMVLEQRRLGTLAMAHNGKMRRAMDTATIRQRHQRRPIPERQLQVV